MTATGLDGLDLVALQRFFGEQGVATAGELRARLISGGKYDLANPSKWENGGEGGKTLHLSDLMENRGLIWASDRAAWISGQILSVDGGRS